MAIKLPDEEGYRRTASGQMVRRPTPQGRQTVARANQMIGTVAKDMAQQYAQRTGSYDYSAALSASRALASGRVPAQQQPAVTPRRPAGSGGGGGGGGGYGGGGGGGGVNTAGMAQGAMDYLTRLLASDQFTAKPETGTRDAITRATQQDQAAATGSFDALDAWLGANNTNPYANVQLQRANVGPSYNPYLESQGIAGLNQVTQNPDDSYGAFQNVLALLGANQVSGNQSRAAESQMSRAYTGNMIGAMDNALLAQVSARESQRQQALDDQKRQALAELAALVQQGARAPDLPSMGVYAPGGNAQDPLGWAAIAAALAPK